ncbi:MAG: hypothetical protein IPN01_20360 [Deltaproteobacteria bacterium]|nr:hypothetical protein [Deltaproteobacteria bacterium]
MGPLILFAALAALGFPFAEARPALSRAYALALACSGALAVTQTTPERLLLSHKLQLAVTLQVSEWSPILGLGLLGAVMLSPSPRLWAAAALGLCAALSMNPAFTALSLGLCAFALSGAVAPAAWIVALSLWAGIWAGEGSAAVTLLAGGILVVCARGGPGERVAAIAAAGLFTTPGAELSQTGAFGLLAAVALIGRAAWTGAPWMALVGVGLTLANLDEPGLALSLMVAGLIPEPAPQAPRVLLTPISAATAALAVLVLGAGLGPAPALILPLGVALWALLRHPPRPGLWSLIGPGLALAVLIQRWGRG